MDWFEDNLWAVAIIYLVCGPLIALFGTRWFPYIVASLVAVLMMCIICGISLACDWMDSTGGTIATCFVALVLGITTGYFVRRNIRLMLGLLGGIAGFFSGSLLFALISSMSGWDSVWGFWVISGIFAIIGFIAAIRYGRPVVMFSTSLVGSYLFMRAWTLLFPGNFPSESELFEGKNFDTEPIFWAFIAIFAVSFAISFTYQHKYARHHHELDDHFKC